MPIRDYHFPGFSFLGCTAQASTADDTWGPRAIRLSVPRFRLEECDRVVHSGQLLLMDGEKVNDEARTDSSGLAGFVV